MNVILGLFDFLNPFSGMQQELSLLMLAFKIVILLFIIQFVRNRFGSGTIVTLLVLGLGYIMLFTNYFVIFGPMMFIYMFISFGFITLLFDLAIAKPWQSREKADDHTSSAKEEHEMNQRTQKMRRGGM